jgi:DNA-binding IclR family transcriptional regulator
LRTLVHHGWLYLNPETKSYELGGGLLRDASGILRRAKPLLAIAAVVRELPPKTQTSCILSEPHEDGGFVVVEKANAPGKLEISYPIGHYFPRDASAQMQALLAWAPPEASRRWLAGWQPTPYTPATATSFDDVLRQLDLARRRGYALSVDEFTVGIGAIALPIFDSAGQVIFILDCVSLTPEIRARERQIASALQAAVAEIHRSIGARPPDGFSVPTWRVVNA